jgi:type IV fimbrial biogenesis protein FimT
MPAAQRHSQLGTSLVEASVVVAIAATLAGAVMPGWNDTRERRQLEAVSAQLGTDLRLARSMAVSLGRSVRLHVDPAGRCYVVHTGPRHACRCSPEAPPVCDADAEALRVAPLPATGAVRIAGASSSMLFDAHRGTVTPTGTLRLSLRDGRAIHHVVNIMGRVRTCSPDGAVAGHPTC